MKIITTPIKDLLVIEPQVFKDDRGYFCETYNEKRYRDAGIECTFVQDNQSMSQKGVLRGLHFQKPPFAQAKLVSVIQGGVMDVAVDLRKNSPTYGMHHSVIITAENHLQFFLPEGFAHGFLTLENDTIFSYKCSQLYNKASEGAIMYNDPTINIDWNIENPILSEKDKTGDLFKNFTTPF